MTSAALLKPTRDRATALEETERKLQKLGRKHWRWQVDIEARRYRRQRDLARVLRTAHEPFEDFPEPLRTKTIQATLATIVRGTARPAGIMSAHARIALIGALRAERQTYLLLTKHRRSAAE